MFYLQTLEMFEPTYQYSQDNIVDWTFVSYGYVSHSCEKLTKEFKDIKQHFMNTGYVIHTYYLKVFDTWEEMVDFTNKHHSCSLNPSWV